MIILFQVYTELSVHASCTSLDPLRLSLNCMCRTFTSVVLCVCITQHFPAIPPRPAVCWGHHMVKESSERKKKKKALQSHYTCWHWPCNSVEVACLQRLEKFIYASAVDRLKAHCVVLGEDILIRRGRIVIDTNKLSARASLNNLTLKDNFIPFHFVFFKLFWGPCFPQRTACLLSYGKDEYFWVCLISSLVLLKLSLNVFSKTT